MRKYTYNDRYHRYEASFYENEVWYVYDLYTSYYKNNRVSAVMLSRKFNKEHEMVTYQRFIFNKRAQTFRI